MPADQPVSQADAAFFELRSLCGWDRPQWEKFLTLPQNLQRMTLDNLGEQDWTKPGTPAFDRVMELLAIVGTIAGIAGGVAGATSAIAALRNL